MAQNQLTKPISKILNNCLKLKKNETLLVYGDYNSKSLATKIFDAVKTIAAKSKSNNSYLCIAPPTEKSGQEPAKEAAECLLQFDAILLITSTSLTHTKAREKATKKGARIASMPKATEAMLERCINIDYNAMRKRTLALTSRLNKADTVRVTTSTGTNIAFSVKGRKAIGDTGDLSKKGACGNLPAGESFIAPVEGSANGIIIVDGSVGDIGLAKDIKITVKNGKAIDIMALSSKQSIKQKALMLKKALFSVKNARNVAEFGIGTNPKAIITGNVLEDEKAYNTCHIAFGSNIFFGGRIKSELHWDIVIRNPKINFE